MNIIDLIRNKINTIYEKTDTINLIGQSKINNINDTVVNRLDKYTISNSNVINPTLTGIFGSFIQATSINDNNDHLIFNDTNISLIKDQPAFLYLNAHAINQNECGYMFYKMIPKKSIILNKIFLRKTPSGKFYIVAQFDNQYEVALTGASNPFILEIFSSGKIDFITILKYPYDALHPGMYCDSTNTYINLVADGPEKFQIKGLLYH